MADEKRRSFERDVRAAVGKYSQVQTSDGVRSLALDAPDSDSTALSVARDRNAPSTERAAALHALAPGLRNDEQFIHLLLKLSANSGEPPELRAGVLRILRQLRFTSIKLREMRAEYIQALRPIIDDVDPMLRQDVLEMLAQEKDEYTQRRLLDSLTSDAPLAPREKIIQFLGYDIHAEYFPQLRELATKAARPEVRREAIRLLGSDAGSVGLLRSIFLDRKEEQQLRRASANGYLSLDPEGFELEAKRVVSDADDDDDVRAAALSALAHFAHPSARDAQLNRVVRELEKRDLTKPLADAVRTYRRRQGDD